MGCSGWGGEGWHEWHQQGPLSQPVLPLIAQFWRACLPLMILGNVIPSPSQSPKCWKLPPLEDKQFFLVQVTVPPALLWLTLPIFSLRDGKVSSFP